LRATFDGDLPRTDSAVITMAAALLVGASGNVYCGDADGASRGLLERDEPSRVRRGVVDGVDLRRMRCEHELA
jgi:hypothetical protein